MSESGWLIERLGGFGVALGTCDGEWRWTSPSLAIRFAREEDARAVLSTFNGRVRNNAVVREHGWPDVSARKAGT